MSNSWDSLATSFRNLSIGLCTKDLALTLLALIAMQFLSTKLVKTETIISTISYVDEQSKLSKQDAYQSRFILPDGSEIEIWVMESPVPKVGDRVPLDVEYYDDGEKVYRINYMKWHLNEGG